MTTRTAAAAAGRARRRRVAASRKMPEPAHMGWYVCGVVAAPAAALPAVTGMDGHELHAVEHDGLAAVVTEVVMPRPPGRRRDLMSHSDVLTAVAEDQDVV